jgi:hypothetical protein
MYSAAQVFECMCIAFVLYPPLLYLSWKQKWHITIRQQAEHRTIYASNCWKMILSGFGSASTNGFSTYEILLAFVDYVQCGLLTVLYCMTVYYKLALPGRLPFMLMPCHLHSIALLYCIFSDARKEVTNKVSYIALCLMWGTLLALIAPDMDGLDQIFEVEHFWLLHIILMTLPVTWIFRRRFHIYHGLHGLVAAWCAFSLIAIYPVQLISIVLARNVTYMMMPPGILRPVGTPYRKVFGLICLPALILFTRYVFAEFWILVGRVRQQLDDDIDRKRESNDQGSPSEDPQAEKRNVMHRRRTVQA